MYKRIPVNLLSVLEHWFQLGVTCIKSFNTVSDFFELACGIRQGGVQGPYLFALYIDSVVDKSIIAWNRLLRQGRMCERFSIC